MRHYVVVAALIVAVSCSVAMCFSGNQQPLLRRARSVKPVVTHTKLANGKTRTTARGFFNTDQKQLQDPTEPPILQAHKMTWIISNYCNNSLQLTEQAILNGGFNVAPPQIATSFFKGVLAGFEASPNPGQEHATFNGTFTYQMINGANPGVDQLQAAFFLQNGEWGMDCVWATAWNPMLYVSEYERVAVYTLGMGDPHWVNKPIC